MGTDNSDIFHTFSKFIMSCHKFVSVINFFVVWCDVVNASVVVKADLSVVTRLGRVVGTWEGTKRVRREVEESVLDVVLAFFLSL